MFYIHTPSGDYPLTITDMRLRHPNVSFPVSLTDEEAADFDIYPVQEVTQPTAPGKVAVRGTPELVAGVWRETWTLVDAPPEPVPASVTMRQARLALLAGGLLSSVDAVLAAIPNAGQRQAAIIEWEYSSAVLRDNPLIMALGVGLGLDSDGIDSLFRLAATL